MRKRALAALLAVTLAPWTLGAAQDAPAPQVTDPEGDAVWYRSGDVAGSGASAACGVAGRLSWQACGGIPLPPSVGGTPAPPLLDIVQTTFWEESDHLIVELGVAALSNELVTSDAPADEYFGFAVCWAETSEGGCSEGTGLGFYRVNGTVQSDPWYFRSDETCAKTTVCYFAPDVTLVPGSPGYVRWAVPRAAMPPQTTAIHSPTVFSFHQLLLSAAADPGYDVSAEDVRAEGGIGPRAWTTVDFAGPGAAAPLAPPRTPWSPDLPWNPTTTDPEADVPAARADLDIHQMTLVEAEGALTVALQVAEVGEIPLDHHLVVDLFPTTGASVTAGYSARDGVRTPWSGTCDGGCSPNPRKALAKPAEIAVEPGAPGWINVTFSRGDLGSPARGDTIGSLYVALLLPEAMAGAQPPAQLPEGDARVEQRSLHLGDFVWVERPWWFRLGADAIVRDDSRAIVLEDTRGDVGATGSATALLSNLDAFDIVSLRAEGSKPGELRVELGVQDLTSIAPPTGYSAVFYAAAVSTERGAFMAGYYADDAKKQFFCAPDTAVFSKPESDPNDVVWQAIEGLISIARDRGAQAAGGSSPGSIVFLVPYSCFDERTDGDLPLDGFAAATFILRAGSVERLDDVQSEGPVTVLGALVAPAPFYAAPFGIENFWDITGIVSAILVALLGAVAIRRKQGALRRYLHEIEHVLREHAGDARSREAALQSIHDRVKDDLLKNRITEAHFVIVERRLDQHLSKVRVHALSEAFGDLPHRLLLTLQDALRDGAMDPEDWRLFRTHLAAEAHLTPQAREAIEARVAAWVRGHDVIRS